MSVLVKDPDESLDYSVDWAGELANGEGVQSSIWVTDGLTQVSVAEASGMHTIVLSGGEIGRLYKVVNRVRTDQGRTIDQTITIRVQGK